MGKLRISAFMLLFMLMAVRSIAADIRGRVVDAESNDPLIGAAVKVDGTDLMAVADIDGRFTISGLDEGKTYNIKVEYVSYKTVTTAVTAVNEAKEVTIKMRPDDKTLGEVTVTGVARHNTEAAMVQLAKESSVIVSNVSAQEIAKTQDGNAGEVIRRVPGVSLIDEKFVMVRGLSQRYNNVWINGGAVPSSEADSRAFSFDLIPSSQIDNIQIVKTPAPEYPADYTGGFITIETKDIPAQNTAEISVGGNWNDNSAFTDFTYAKGSGTDFLGFDSGKRSLSGGIDAVLNPQSASIDNSVALLGNGFNNDWKVKTMKPLGDFKMSASLGHRWNLGGQTLGLIAAVNYTNEYRRFDDMANNLYGAYNASSDKSVPLHEYTDQQFNHNVRVGAMLNLTLLSKSGRNKYQLKNIFNQIGNDRYTSRAGLDYQTNNERSSEYYYRSRTTYNGQITGKHTFKNDVLDWSGSYSYANRNVPDRRRALLNDQANSTETIQISRMTDLSREWTYLHENIFSAAVNDNHNFTFGSWQPSLKVGAYGEYRNRDYKTRMFYYAYNSATGTLPSDYVTMDVTELLSNPSYYGEDKLYLSEKPNRMNWYKGKDAMGAGYLAATLPFGKFSVYAGLRYEHSHMVLTSYTRDDAEAKTIDYKYNYNDLFPSVNTTYKFNDKHQLRLSYGKTVNRQEFREVSPSQFYDFDLAAAVRGNVDLKPCYIQNVDLRYEFYPSRGEMISIAAFYKYFDSPIEWTYTVMASSEHEYSYKNAHHANNYGIELDIRKDLSFIGLRNFSLSFNGALIKSRVKFEAGAKDENRPMQGQSPYLINTGLFYKNEKAQLDVAVLYNRIGKRIIGVGRSVGTTSGNESVKVPDSYEMPRDLIDLSASKRFGKHWEVKFNIKDLLAQKVYYKQFVDVHYEDGSGREVEQITRSFKPGRNFGLSATYKF